MPKKKLHKRDFTRVLYSIGSTRETPQKRLHRRAHRATRETPWSMVTLLELKRHKKYTGAGWSKFNRTGGGEGLNLNDVRTTTKASVFLCGKRTSQSK